jgi:hypothetical protein
LKAYRLSYPGPPAAVMPPSADIDTTRSVLIVHSEATEIIFISTCS